MKIHKKTSTEVWLKGENTADFIRMKLIKSHKEFGNFYVFNSVFSMPYQRQAMFNLINQYNQLGIDKDELIASNIEILKLLESKEAGYDMKIYNKVAEIIKTAKSFWDYQKKQMSQELIEFVLNEKGENFPKTLQRFNLPTTAVGEYAQNEPSIRWTSDGKNLAFINEEKGTSNIWLKPLKGNELKKLTNFAENSIYRYDWSANGKKLAVTRYSSTSDVAVIKATN